MSLFCAYEAFKNVSLYELISSLKKLSISLLILSILCQFIQLILKAVRWDYLLQPFVKLSRRLLFEIYVIGLMLNDTLPSAKIGEISRAYLVKKQSGFSLLSTFSTIIVERIIDVLVILVFLVYVLLIGKLNWKIGDIDIKQYTPYLLAFSLIFFLLIFLIVFSDFIRRYFIIFIKNILNRNSFPFAAKINEIIESFFKGLNLSHYTKIMPKTLLISFIAWFLILISTWLIFKAFNADQLDFNDAILVIVITAFSMMIPSSPGYIGTYHFLAIETLKYRGIEANTAAAMAIILHASWHLLEVSLGLIFFFRLSLSFSEIKKIKLNK